MTQQIYYIVESDGRYLDGFTGPNVDQPVWKSDLQAVDPFIREEIAREHCKLAGSGCIVRNVGTDSEGNNVLLARLVEKDYSGKAPGTMNADDILRTFGIAVDSDGLSDGSRTWNVLLSDSEVNCLSEKHARQLAMDIAVAIRNATAL